ARFRSPSSTAAPIRWLISNMSPRSITAIFGQDKCKCSRVSAMLHISMRQTASTPFSSASSPARMGLIRRSCPTRCRICGPEPHQLSLFINDLLELDLLGVFHVGALRTIPAPPFRQGDTRKAAPGEVGGRKSIYE